MDVAQEVIAAAEDRGSALAAGDADRLRQFLHEQFSWTTHVGETLDRSEYIRRNTEGQTVWRSQVLLHPEVVVGDTAVLRTEVTDETLSASGDIQTFRMPMTQVWVRLAAAGSVSLVTRAHAGRDFRSCR
jgi:hypothetical protein